MADPTGETDRSALRLDFDRRLMLQFRGSAITSCKRKVQMTPLCKVEMALLGFRNREMHQLRHEAADRKEGRSPPLPALHFVT